MEIITLQYALSRLHYLSQRSTILIDSEVHFYGIDSEWSAKRAFTFCVNKTPVAILGPPRVPTPRPWPHGVSGGQTQVE